MLFKACFDLVKAEHELHDERLDVTRIASTERVGDIIRALKSLSDSYKISLTDSNSCDDNVKVLPHALSALLRLMQRACDLSSVPQPETTKKNLEKGQGGMGKLAGSPYPGFHDLKLAASVCESIGVIFEVLSSDEEMRSCVKEMVSESKKYSKDSQSMNPKNSDGTSVIKSISHLLLLLLASLESVKAIFLASSSSSHSSVNSDIEVIALHALKGYHYLLKCLTMGSPSTLSDQLHNGIEGYDEYGDKRSRLSPPHIRFSTIRPLFGNFFAQLVQLCLFFSRERIKELAEMSTLTLAECLQFMPSSSVWRKYLPGTFSGLFALCTSRAGNSSNVVQSSALVCIARLLTIVMNDADSLNRCICDSNDLEADHSPVLADSSSSNNVSRAAFNNLVNSIPRRSGYESFESSKPTLLSNNLSSPPVQPSVTSLESRNGISFPYDEFPSLESARQWRVDILQRIGQNFIIAFKSVYSMSSSPTRKKSILVGLGEILAKCKKILGHTLYIDFLLLLLEALDDEFSNIRETAWVIWQKIIGDENNLRMESDNVHSRSLQSPLLISQLENKFVFHGYEVDRLTTNEMKYQQNISLMLGIAYSLEDTLHFVIKAEGISLLNCLCRMFLPLRDAPIPLLETRKFYRLVERHVESSTSTTEKQVDFVSGQYYRLLFANAKSKTTLRASRVLAMIFGKAGSLSNLLQMVMSVHQKFERRFATYASTTKRMGSEELATVVNRSLSADEKSLPIKSSADTFDETDVVLMLKKTASIWTFIKYAILGNLKVRADVPVKKESCSENSTEPNYGSCNGERRPSTCGYCGCVCSERRCSRCKCVSYCCVDHQKLDWKTHRLVCVAPPPSPTSSNVNVNAKRIEKTVGVIDSDENEICNSDLVPPNSPLDPDLILSSANISISLAISDNITTKSLAYNIEEIVKVSLRILKSYFHQQDLLATGIHILPSSLKIQQLHAIIISTICECLANASLIAALWDIHISREYQNQTNFDCEINGTERSKDKFRPKASKHSTPLLSNMVRDISYMMCELSVDSNHIVRDAALASLSRIALYSGHDNVTGLLYMHLDCIVDEACARMRCSHDMTSFHTKSLTRTHQVIDYVLRKCVTTLSNDGTPYPTKIQSVIALIKDLVNDTLSDIDSQVYKLTPAATLAILGCMNVLVETAAEPIDLTFMATAGIPWSKHSPYASTSTGSNIVKRLLKGKNDHALTETVERPALCLSMDPPENIQDTDNAKKIMEHEIRGIVKSLTLFQKNIYNLNSKASNSLENLQDDDNNGGDLSKECSSSFDTRNSNEGDSSSSSTTPPVPQGLELIQEILSRCRYFICQTSPEGTNFNASGAAIRVKVIEIMSKAFVRLALSRSVLLPAIHTTWPSIIGRLKEQIFFYAESSLTAMTKSTMHIHSLESSKASKLLLDFGKEATHSNAKPCLPLDSFPPNSTVHSPLSQLTTRSISSESEYGSRSKCLLLFPLLELTGVIAILCGDFLGIKFSDDLWPHLSQLLSIIHRNDIDLLEKSLQSSRNMQLHSSATAATSVPASKFSLDSKTKLSILSLLKTLVGQCFREYNYDECDAGASDSCSYIKSVIGECTWLILPFLSSLQCEDVRMSANELLSGLYRLNPSLVETILRGVGRRNDIVSFTAVMSHPQLVAISNIFSSQKLPSKGNQTSTSTSFVSVNQGERVTRILQADEMWMKLVSSLLQTELNLVPQFQDVSFHQRLYRRSCV